jgi:hypothetical protein
MCQNDFNRILLSAVDEGLSSLGDSSRQAILFHLETSFKIKKEDIPKNFIEFKKALEAIFGSGAIYLEDMIAKRLYEKLGLEPEKNSQEDFLKSVERRRAEQCLSTRPTRLKHR